MTTTSLRKDRVAVATVVLCALYLVGFGFAAESAQDVATGAWTDVPVLAAWIFTLAVTRLAAWPVWSAYATRVLDATEVPA